MLNAKLNRSCVVSPFVIAVFFIIPEVTGELSLHMERMMRFESEIFHPIALIEPHKRQIKTFVAICVNTPQLKNGVTGGQIDDLHLGNIVA